MNIFPESEHFGGNAPSGGKKIQKSGAKRGKVVDKGGSWGAKWRT